VSAVRKRGVLTAWVLVIATLLPVARSQADELLRQRAGTALDATGRRISIAENRVSSNPSDQAQRNLEASQREQARALTAFAAAQYAVAVSSTLSARDHADRAIAIARNLPDPERVLAQVGRTRDVLGRARRGIETSGNPEARSALQVALGMQSRAESALGETRYMAALLLTMSARERVFSATRLCNLDEAAPQGGLRELPVNAPRPAADALPARRSLLRGSLKP
jgi:hypothetical protein